jgi:hypothetical protein
MIAEMHGLKHLKLLKKVIIHGKHLFLLCLHDQELDALTKKLAAG